MPSHVRDASTDAYCIVRAEILGLGIPGLAAAAIAEDSLLIDDLGMDSFRFLDLVVRLEDALGLDEFPMQEWVDAQLQAGLPLSVGLLARECGRLLADRSAGRT